MCACCECRRYAVQISHLLRSRFQPMFCQPRVLWIVPAPISFNLAQSVKYTQIKASISCPPLPNNWMNISCSTTTFTATYVFMCGQCKQQLWLFALPLVSNYFVWITNESMGAHSSINIYLTHAWPGIFACEYVWAALLGLCRRSAVCCAHA